MSDTKPTATGRSNLLVELLLVGIVIYTSIYFLFFNSASDELQKTSFSTAIIRPIQEVIAEHPTLSKFSKDLDKRMKQCEETWLTHGIDMGKPLGAALKENPNISNISFNYGMTEDSYTQMIARFDLKGVGHIQLASRVQMRSYLKFRNSKFIEFNAIAINERRTIGRTQPLIFLAEHIYGFNPKQLSHLTEFVLEFYKISNLK